MEQNLNNRIAKPQGRPPNYEKQAPTEAVPDLTQRHVPPLVCPKCGRGMTPRVERWRSDAIGTFADCICVLTNCKFIYRPAETRVKS